MYIDIGVNLANFNFSDPGEIIENASRWKLDAMILTGTTYHNSKESADIVEKYSGKHPVKLYSTVGIDPMNAKTWRGNTGWMEKLLQKPYVVAVGKCGLDYSADRLQGADLDGAKKQQKVCFEDQVKLAQHHRKPIFLHEREASADFTSILSKYPEIHGVVHCFTGNRDTAKEYVKMGLWFGITGWLCDNRRNRDLLSALSVIPLDRIMIESDAPYLHPLREGRINHEKNWPSNVYYIIKRLAEELKMDEDKLAQICHDNTIRFFDLH